ncbi:glycosyltransferase family 4 protein [Paenibacillus sp. GP183]|uniref:glycosyltransferase family 4 protein n=1 Tax=Paenibacillus sp. GP183 TaxID=1882751 RepID=UPI00089B2D26|nr:glycosyltransferase family 4 protein [Paenibacillus sp. GP183]SEC69090.1 Glycosyltransferase involved in cell wall bisynthesis [Paenibacillus sp. GP183]
MKLLLFSHLCSQSHITGAEKLLLFMVQELRSDHECVMVVPNEGVLSKEASLRGIRVIVMYYPLLLSTYQPGPWLFGDLQRLLQEDAYRTLASLLLAEEPDAVLANTCVNALPAAAAKTLGIPVAWMITETMMENEYIHLSVDLIDRYSDWIIGISRSTLRFFQHEKLGPKLCTLFPSWRMDELNTATWPSHRINKRTEWGVGEQEQVVGYVSSDIYPNKGLEHFIQMSLAIGNAMEHVHFFIIGKPTDLGYYGYCLQLIEQSGFASRFHISPFEQHIEGFYPALDVAVIPSLLNEGFGMTALEGMVFAKPVVAYRSGGLEEILTMTGNAAFLAEKGNTNELISKVHRLLENPQLRKEVGERNGEEAQRVFGIVPYRARLKEWFLAMKTHQKAPASVLQTMNSTELHDPSSLLICGQGPTVYLLHSGVRYPIPSESRFKALGYSFDRVFTLPDDKLDHFDQGQPIAGLEEHAKVSKKHKRRSSRKRRRTVIKKKKRPLRKKFIKTKKSTRISKRVSTKVRSRISVKRRAG